MEWTQEQSWRLFLATGLPEAYLWAKQREQEARRADRDKGHRPAGGGL
jgi:hypothetical protein